MNNGVRSVLLQYNMREIRSAFFLDSHVPRLKLCQPCLKMSTIRKDGILKAFELPAGSHPQQLVAHPLSMSLLRRWQ